MNDSGLWSPLRSNMSGGRYRTCMMYKFSVKCTRQFSWLDSTTQLQAQTQLNPTCWWCAPHGISYVPPIACQSNVMGHFEPVDHVGHEQLSITHLNMFVLRDNP